MLYNISCSLVFAVASKKIRQKSYIILSLSLVFLSLISNAQKTNKAFLSAAFQVDIPKNTNGVGARVAYGANINQLFLLGVGFGVTKIREENTIFPLSAHFAIGNFSKKAYPYFVAEPGYGLYNKAEVIANKTITTKGGFSFYGGAGMGVSTGKKSKATFTVGYSLYNFDTEGISSSLGALLSNLL